MQLIAVSSPKAEVEGSNPFGSANFSAVFRQFSPGLCSPVVPLFGKKRQNATGTAQSDWHTSDTPRSGRIPFLDALRGLLACVVVAFHVHVAFGGTSLNGVARAAVLIFFAMSGYVLARAYDGRPLAFMARRLVRLWPPYALVLAIAYALHGEIVPLWVLAWWTPGSSAWPDPPAWSLFWEGWATFVLPLAFWVLARSRGAMLALAGGSLGLSLILPEMVNVAFFALGVAGAGFAIPWPREVPAWCEWLGKISFSLYLSHAVVMKAAYDLAGPWAVLASLPLVFLVAWGLWWAVERPSIAWSRRVGRIARRSNDYGSAG